MTSTKPDTIVDHVMIAAKRAAALCVCLCFLFMLAQKSEASDLDWSTRPATDVLAGSDVATVDGVTVTTSGSFTGSPSNQVMRIFPTSTYNTHTGVIGMQMDASTDNGSVFGTLTLQFSRPVSNLSFTVADIDGGTFQGWNDTVVLSPIPALVSSGSNVSYNAGTGTATSNGSATSGTQGDLTVNFAGPLTTVTIQWIADNASGSNPGNQVIFLDDLNFTIVPRVTVQKISKGGTGTFSFTRTNLASVPPSITTTASDTATPASPTAINVSTIGTAVTVTETPASGFTLTTANCTDANSAVTGNTGTLGTLAGSTLTIPAGNVVAGADFNCTLTNTRALVKLQKITTGGFGGPFAFTSTNLVSTPTGITTTSVATAAPISPAPINVATLGTAVTLTETVATGYQITSASCTDANSVITGNTGSIGTLAGNVLTIPAANVKTGADFTCTFTNRKIPTLTLQKITNGSAGGPFGFSATNLAAVPGNITTTASGTPAPASPTAINITTVGTAVTITETVATGYSVVGATCTDANSAVTGNTGSFGTLAGSTLTIAASRIVAGAQFSCTFTNRKTPTVKLQKITTSGFGGPFTFAQTNLASTPAGITTTAASTAAPASPAAINVSTIGTAVTITETVASGYTIVSAACVDANSAITGNTGSIGTLAGNVLTIPAANVVAGADFTCTFSNRKIPAVKLQKITTGGFGGPFTFASTNLASTPAGITTTATSTAAPASPVAINVSTIGTAVTITETVASGYFISAASCTDANSGITGNTGAIGTLAGNTLTIPAANVVDGADFTCVFTNTLSQPQLSITKTADDDTEVAAGQTITYTYVVTNTGNVPISGITLSDEHKGVVGALTPAFSSFTTNTGSTNSGNTITVLQPGDVAVYTATYTVTQTDVDTLQ